MVVKKSAQKKYIHGLGLYDAGPKIFLYYNLCKGKQSYFQLDQSVGGFDFSSANKIPQILISKDKEEKPADMSQFRLAKLHDQVYFLTYVLKEKKGSVLCGALSSDLIRFVKVGRLSDFNQPGIVVPQYGYQGQFAFYSGGQDLRLSFTSDFKAWKKYPKPVLTINESEDGLSLKVANVMLISEGILVIYYLYNPKLAKPQYQIKVALFNKSNPADLMWQTDAPIWKQHDEWKGKKVYPLSVLGFQDNLVSYWNLEDKQIGALNHHFQLSDSPLSWQWKVLMPVLKKYTDNPILRPLAKNLWESKAVFNPAAVLEDDKVHLIYRAVGEGDISVLGYAQSRDGLKIDFRSSQPAYIPREEFEGIKRGAFKKGVNIFKSGVGWGGCEDPRLTKIDSKVYMTYVAYNGWSHPRVALTSIDVQDFKNQNWQWHKSVLISKPGIIDKNACIFPEKVQGKYVIFHRVFPNILIDFVDNLDFDGQTFLQGEYRIEPRKNQWDSRKVGVGPTPIKTDDGWLIIYHAVDDRADYQYQMGAMLLKTDDPTKVLCRSIRPILQPTEYYENEGFKSGVAYPCGAVVKDDNLLVYYGGADTVVCAAQANLKNFLSQLQDHQMPKLKSLQFSSTN
jgi:beta-1,2-mannobiose phosphorylase / 1,2-beta-oligomannan phosphorylase